jgi:prevent-host-death family protein
MPTVGVRELKNNANKIVRAVREDHAEYVITVDGEPVAVMRPYGVEDVRVRRQADAAAFMADLAEIRAVLTSAAPTGEMTGLEHLEAMREDRWRSLTQAS